MDDDRIEIKRFHPPDEIPQLFRCMAQQTFTGIEAPYGKQFFHYSLLEQKQSHLYNIPLLRKNCKLSKKIVLHPHPSEAIFQEKEKKIFLNAFEDLNILSSEAILLR
jgi:hypothetical protein